MLSDTFVVEALLNLSHGAVGNSTMPKECGNGLEVNVHPGHAPTANGNVSVTASSSSMQMRRAIDIVQRYHMRGNVLPHQLADRQNDPVLEQEHLDAQKLSKWRQSVKANKKMECSDEVRDFLDREIVGWRDEVNSRKGMNRAVQIQKAREIVERYRARGNELPRKLADRSHPDREQEYKDAQKLTKWKQTLKGNGNSKYNCPDEIRDYLDKEMPHWRDEVREKNCFPMQFAKDIVRRYHERGGVLPRQKSDYRKTTVTSHHSPNGTLVTTTVSKVSSEESQQEYKDARKLHKWRQTLKGNGNGHNCSDEIRDFLDREMVNWRENIKTRNPSKSSRNAAAAASKITKSTDSTENDVIISKTGQDSVDSDEVVSECDMKSSIGSEEDYEEVNCEGNTTHSDRSSPAPTRTPTDPQKLNTELAVDGEATMVVDPDMCRKRARSSSVDVKKEETEAKQARSVGKQ